jgi:hypothetical protein
MKKNAFSYFREGSKETHRFFKHSLFRYFKTYIFAFSDLFSFLLPFLAPVFSLAKENYCKMAAETRDALITKSFQNTTGKESPYLSLIAYYGVLICLAFGGIIVIGGFGTIAFYLCFLLLVSPTGLIVGLTLLAPFALALLVYLCYIILLSIPAPFVARNVPTSDVSDIFYSCVKSLRNGRFWTLFLIQFINFIVFVLPWGILATIAYFSAIYIGGVTAFYIIASIAGIGGVLLVLMLPRYWLRFHLSIHDFLVHNVTCEKVVVIYPTIVETKQDDGSQKEEKGYVDVLATPTIEPTGLSLSTPVSNPTSSVEKK